MNQYGNAGNLGGNAENEWSKGGNAENQGGNLVIAAEMT